MRFKFRNDWRASLKGLIKPLKQKREETGQRRRREGKEPSPGPALPMLPRESPLSRTGAILEQQQQVDLMQKLSSSSFQNLKTGPSRTLNWTQEYLGFQGGISSSLKRSPGQWSEVLEGTVRLFCKDIPQLGQTDPQDHTAVGHTGSIVASPELCVLAPVFKRHKPDAPLDVGEHMGDLEADIVVPLLDGIRYSRKFIQDDLVGIQKLDN